MTTYYYHKHNKDWWETWDLGPIQLHIESDPLTWPRLYLSKGDYFTEGMIKTTERDLQRLILFLFKLKVIEE